MQYKKVLCVGLYDNELTLLLKLLLKKRRDIKFVKSVGIDDYARRELHPSSFVIETALSLGFMIVRHDPIHPAIMQEAERSRFMVIRHRPRHIAVIRDISAFDLIITPYLSVFTHLQKRYGTDIQKSLLINNPSGIRIDLKASEKFSILQSWTENNL